MARHRSSLGEFTRRFGPSDRVFPGDAVGRGPAGWAARAAWARGWAASPPPCWTRR